MKRLLLAFIVAIFCALSPWSDARATILFAGGEDIDFKMVGGEIFSTQASYATGYARSSLGVTTASTSALSPSDYALSPTFTASSVIWVHANNYDNSGNFTSGTILMGVYSPDGVMRIAIRETGTKGQWKISTVNAAGTFTDLATMSGVCFGGALHSFDLYINYASSGEVTLYCGGVSYADYTGNVTTNSATQLSQVALLGDSPGGSYFGWSEIIVSTTSTLNMRLVTLAPAANGNTHNFDTGAAANVNEVTLNQSTVDASGTSGEIQEYTVGALPAGTFNVLDLWLNAQAQVDTTGPQHLQGMVRTGATDYTSSNLAPPQSSWGWISTDWTTNPNTGVAWTTGDLGAAGFNIGYKSAN